MAGSKKRAVVVIVVALAALFGLTTPVGTTPPIAAVPAPAQEAPKAFRTIAQAGTLTEIIEADDYDPVLHAQILRLYPAFFRREADVSGAKYWIEVAKQGSTLADITGFFSSPGISEFAKFYADIPAADNGAYLTRVYRNMHGRAPDPGGFAYWLDLMDRGVLDRGGVVRWIALNEEFVSRYPYQPTGVAPPPAPADGRPNILVIMTDDQRRDSMAALPRISRWMGDQGTTFTQGYVTTPSCCPSRAAVLTGQYNHNNGVVAQHGPPFNEATSIAKYLGDAGYATAHIGKYVHYYPLRERAPFWDRWTAYQGSYSNVQMNLDGRVSRSTGYATRIAFDKAIEYADDFKRADDNQPWLMHVWPTAPHRVGNQPPTVEDKYIGAAVPTFELEPRSFEADISDKPPFMYCCPNQTTQEYIRNLRDEMLRALYSVDEGTDRLLTHLEDTGELQNTLVFFLSDNGFMFGDHQLHEKFVPYENSVGVPFYLRWPGKVPANQTSDRFVSNIDVLPTALAAAGVEIPAIVDGRDILGTAPRERRFTEYFLDDHNIEEVKGWASITTPEYQYTEWYEPNGSLRFREYYNLKEDPFQLLNLLGDTLRSNDPSEATLRALSQQLAADKACSGGSCP